MRQDECCRELEVVSITNTGTQINIDVNPISLDDGCRYFVRLDAAFPTGIIGGEQVVVTVNNATPTIVYLGDRRSRIVRAERIRRGSRLFMLFTEDSLAGATTTPQTATPAFIVVDGLHINRY
jgi:hypothetical protein